MKNYVTFKFTATFSESWPKLKFYIDNDLYHDYQFSQSDGHVTIPVDLLDGDHLIEIELYDKPSNSTKIVDGVITQDQLVTLDNIYVNDICLPAIVMYSGRYEHIPDRIGLTWGVNGKWSLNFQTPLIPWVINFKNLIDDKNSKTLTGSVTSARSSQKNKKILHLLDQIEKELEDVHI